MKNSTITTYTDATDALATFYAWALTNGWTQRMYAADGSEDGARAHISKNISGIERFFNFRSCVTPETLLNQLGERERCILVNGSTGFSSGTNWGRQVNATAERGGSLDTRAGSIQSISNSGGALHLYATDTTLSMVLLSDSEETDWRMITVGEVGVSMAYISSSSIIDMNAVAGTYDPGSYYGGNGSKQGTGTGPRYHHAIYIDGDDWYIASTGNADWSAYNMLNHTHLDSETDTGNVTAAIVANSPDNFRGNTVLAPSIMFVRKDDSDESWQIGEIEGVKFLNMKYHNSTETVVYAGDTYRIYKNWNPGLSGTAFLTDL